MLKIVWHLCENQLKYKTVHFPIEITSLNWFKVKKSFTEDDLKELEFFHNVTEIYNWLSMKFPSEFINYDLSVLCQNDIQNLIEIILTEKMEKSHRKRDWF